MNWLDVLVVILMVAAVVRGFRVGFAQQFFSTLGCLVGLILAAWLESSYIHMVRAGEVRALVAFLLTLGLGLGGITAGEYAGVRLKRELNMTRILNEIDRLCGTLLAVATLLAVVWAGGAIFRKAPDLFVQQQISGSRVVGWLDHTFPSAPGLVANLGNLIAPDSFPQVFSGLEPAAQHVTIPGMSTLTAAVQHDQASVVEIEGQGCGGIVTGSGFVVSGNEVATNAHVVAGVTKPLVVDSKGDHHATVVWFDDQLDLAVLRVSGLAGAPLSLDTLTVEDGTAAAIAGYPGGGNFAASPAAITQTFTALGRDIYNRGHTSRQVYSVTGDVEQGNSGGPLIEQNGLVAGIIFAKSTNYTNIGYVLTAAQVAPSIQQAKNLTKPVGTQSCVE